MKGLAGQMKHYGAVLADRIQHDRALAFRDRFSHDVNALGLEDLEVREWFRLRCAQTPHPASITLFYDDVNSADRYIGGFLRLQPGSRDCASLSNVAL
jgi:hypothetical protein